jgi:hypothetical protein
MREAREKSLPKTTHLIEQQAIEDSSSDRQRMVDDHTPLESQIPGMLPECSIALGANIPRHSDGSPQGSNPT